MEKNEVIRAIEHKLKAATVVSHLVDTEHAKGFFEGKITAYNMALEVLENLKEQ